MLEEVITIVKFLERTRNCCRREWTPMCSENTALIKLRIVLTGIKMLVIAAIYFHMQCIF